MPLKPVATPTKGEAAFVALREAIWSGALAPGERVTLNGLAGQLGMSLTPVREALRRLAEHGLVRHVPNQGTVVTERSVERAEEIYGLRLLLEPVATERAAERMTPDVLAGITAAREEIERAIEAGRGAEVPALNAELHRRIYAASGSEYLQEFIGKLWNGVPFQAISLTGRHERSDGEHRGIVDALAARDGALAARLMTAHISSASEHALRHLAGAPGGPDSA
ncbi:GntR family transcriptional regulator [Pseudonocardia sp. KRD291]|uniref:GntR family transcriptional regulator n=1 Tax=Pseudonocardia sp. KRD291 TaxID=2792007 RepID=UPI001C49D228|nr:GntR family transcriptional regulator [Pseudonocardia sp. KRD291]MBW0101463.1 GntR family transcriptional regulator [Pseudonocardia sp. KRD291]